MEKKIRDFKALLNQHGLKATSQRLLILEAMTKLGHACADMVMAEIGKMDREADRKYTLATIYNTLKCLADAGLLVRRPSINSKMYFDVNTYDHCHLYDVKNHTLTDFDDSELIHIISDYFAAKKPHNFQLEHVDVHFTGEFVK